MKIIVFGIGMYVAGENESSYGTILPALIEYKKNNNDLKKITFIKKNKSNINLLDRKINKIFSINRIKLDFEIKYNFDLNLKKFLNSEEKPDCAIICLPDHLHYKYTNICLQNNIHCLVVKPLTTKLFDAKKLSELAKKNNLYAAVEFHKRWDKQNLIIKEKFDNKTLGDPLYSIVEYSQRKIIPSKIFKKWAAETNILNYLGVHYIDIMKFVSGAKPVRVMAIGQNNWLKKNSIKTFDSIQCLIEWKLNKNKFIQNINVNWIDPNNTSSMSDQKIKVIFSKGRIECDQKNRGIEIISDNNLIEHINPDFNYKFTNYDNLKSSWQGYGINSILTFLNDINDIGNKKITINKLNKFRPVFKEAIYSTAILECANKSLKNGNEWIKIIL